MTRVERLDWKKISSELTERGFANTGKVLSAGECKQLVESYPNEDLYRSTVVMARHGFGKGEYRYFRYPLPKVVETLRTELYPRLAETANEWEEVLGKKAKFPDEHADHLKLCHAAGQNRPTPLVLKYGEGDYNCLHQDLYGDMYFPLQVAFLLNDPHKDFEGGEFVLVEQRPRMQSRAEVVPLSQGEGVIFAVNQRPMRGSRGYYRVAMRHGVSRLRAGRRYTLGLIFHDSK